MDLKMFLGNELIDEIKINRQQLNMPGYIERLKMEMEDRNDDIIDLRNEEPQFFIETIPSSMNLKKFQRMN